MAIVTSAMSSMMAPERKEGYDTALILHPFGSYLSMSSKARDMANT
jgi:hypothetical protein